MTKRRADSKENFLKAVYALQQTSERVSTNALAEALQITAPSVTDMARRMATADLIDYQKHYGVRLTDSGLDLALKVIRRHRLIETYLVHELGYALHEVHAEAEDLEHAVSDRFVEALAHKLGHPRFDPHGDTIPSADGQMPARALIPLTDLPPLQPALVARLTAANDAMLQHILDKGLALNVQVQLVSQEPFQGPLTLLVKQQTRVLGHAVAACVWVEQQQN
jgi:DtxR family transcriptional regulator, Mn-dependent transcriptional regulator